MLSVGTDVSESLIPLPAAVISRQPTRSVFDSSRNSSWAGRSRSTFAVNSQTSRVVMRSAWPTGWSLVALETDQVIRRPSTVDRSVRDTSSHHCRRVAGAQALLQRRDLRDVDHGSQVDAVRVQVQAVVVVDAEVAQRVGGRLAVDEEDPRQQQSDDQDGAHDPTGQTHRPPRSSASLRPAFSACSGEKLALSRNACTSASWASATRPSAARIMPRW